MATDAVAACATPRAASACARASATRSKTPLSWAA